MTMSQPRPFVQLITILLALSTTLADYAPYYNSSSHETGLFGDWPTETYRSSPLVGPALNYVQHSALCDDDSSAPVTGKITGTGTKNGNGNGLYMLLAPRGSAVRTPGPMIIDKWGHLVWTKDYGQTSAFGVYTFKEQQYLAFGVENDGIRGFGDGVYYMLDSSYNEAYKIKGANELPVDLRDFHITNDETALLTAYEIKPADLRSFGGAPDGQIYDSILQEVDIVTGKLLFQWRASQHVDFDQVPRPEHLEENAAWDFLHINSIDKDSNGNYLVSCGAAHSLNYVDGRTGNVLWSLGGTNNTFSDLSAGAATKFNNQHHARFQEDGTAITLFDTKPSRGLYLDLNTSSMTVSLRHEYINTNIPANVTNTDIPPDTPAVDGGGSLQALHNGNIIQGYGLTPAWTEYSPAGEILCHVHYGSASTFNTARVYSTRALKIPWKGVPNTEPTIAFFGYEASVSWNGATEVVTYILQGASDPDLDKKHPHPNLNKDPDTAETADTDIYDDGFTLLAAYPRTGFETILPIPSSISPKTTTHLRILALNDDGHVLGITRLTHWDPAATKATVGTGGPANPGPDMRPFLWFVFGFLVACALAVAVWVIRRRIAARRVSRKLGKRASGRAYGGRGHGEWDSDDDYGEDGWDDEGVGGGELSDEELIDAVEFSLLGGGGKGNNREFGGAGGGHGNSDDT